MYTLGLFRNKYCDSHALRVMSKFSRCEPDAEITLTEDEYNEWVRAELAFAKWQDRFDKILRDKDETNV